jgi:hypothetical protein
MVLKYVLKNFRRRKVRTLLMVLSLLVSTGLIVAMSATVETVRQSNVELIASGVGRYDLTVAKTDISSEPFVEVDRVSQAMLTADPSITAVYPPHPIHRGNVGQRRAGQRLARRPGPRRGRCRLY